MMVLHQIFRNLQTSRRAVGSRVGGTEDIKKMEGGMSEKCPSTSQVNTVL